MNIFVAANTAAEHVRKIFERVVVAGGIIFLKQLLNDFVAQYVKFVILCRAKFRVEINPREIPPQNRLAERVERRNLRAAQKNYLPLQVSLTFAVEFKLKSFRQRGLNS